MLFENEKRYTFNFILRKVNKMKNEMWLIWKHPETRQRYKIGILIYKDSKYIFEYVNPELDDALHAGFRSFPGFENIYDKYESYELFANIETRLPNTTRPDYLEILNSYGLDKESTKFDILKATKGRLITDNYEFVPAFETKKIEFDVAGTRHCSDVKKCKNLLNVNDSLELELDSTNKYDQYAIKVFLTKDGRKYHLGYVPRYYSKELFDLLNKNVEYSAMIQSLNLESQFSDEDVTAFVKLIFNEK